jgi:hypothetical protein
MSDRFHSAVLQLRAEQFFEEKAASARGGLTAVGYALFVKSANELCKQAEPPPPKGVSSSEWDRILAKVPTKGPASRLIQGRSVATK